MKKSTILATLVSMMIMSGSAFAEEKKDTSNEANKELSSQVIESGKEAKAEVSKDEEKSEPKRPFHHVGRSENG